MKSIARDLRTLFALTVPAELTGEQLSRLRADWDANIGGPMVILQPGFDLKAFNADVRDEPPPPAGWDTLENVR